MSQTDRTTAALLTKAVEENTIADEGYMRRILKDIGNLSYIDEDKVRDIIAALAGAVARDPAHGRFSELCEKLDVFHDEV